MRQVKIYTVTQVDHVGHEQHAMGWRRAFASREEAVDAIREDALEQWQEMTGGGKQCPGVSEDEVNDFWLEVSPEEVYVQYILVEADLDLPRDR